MAAEWFYRSSDQKSEPVDSRELRRLAETGIVRPDTLVRKGVDGRWVRAERVRGLFQRSTPAPSSSLGASPPPPLPMPESVAPTRGVSGESSIRHGLGAAAVNDAPEKPERIWPVTWAAIIVGSGAVLLLLWALVFRGGSAPQQQADRDRHALSTPADLQAEDRPVTPADLYAEVQPAVVTIETEDDFGTDAGQGSGFFVEDKLVQSRYGGFSANERSNQYLSDGTGRPTRYAYLLTNYHVIDSAAKASVRTPEGREGYVIEVVAESEPLDLAVLCVCLDGCEVPPVLHLGRLPPRIGDKVLAVGSPQGLEASLSEGIISGERQFDDGTKWLQTTAPIGPGSSGGPLLNEAGRVVGVMTASRRNAQNVNRAVPISEVTRFLESPYNTRKLWEGSGIEKKETDAYIHAAAVSTGRARRAESTVSESMAGELLKMPRLLRKGDYDAIERLLDDIPLEQLGEWEFVWHHARGRAAVWRANRTWNQANDGQAFDAKMRQHPDHQVAVVAFRKAIYLKPAFSPSHLGLAECYLRERRLSEGLVIADKLVEMMPRSTRAYHLRGEFYAELDRNRDAYRDFTKAAEMGTTYADVYREIGEACRALGKNAEAVTAYETAIKLGLGSPYDELCHYNCGLAHKAMGQYEEAIVCFQEARKLMPPAADKKIAECRAAMR